MPVYVYRDGRMVDKRTGEPMNPGDNGGPPPCPQIISDIEPYQSPVTGEYVGGRRAKRYDLEKNNCVDANELGRSLGGKLRNPRFAKKWGMESRLTEEACES
jgi:hypothetical protein